MKLAVALPELANELALGLSAAGHAQLAEAAYSIEIAERCPCDDPGCVTFYTMKKVDAPSPSKCKRVVAPASGVLCVQHVGSEIVWIEVLGRPNDRAKLDHLAGTPGGGEQTVAHGAAGRATL